MFDKHKIPANRVIALRRRSSIECDEIVTNSVGMIAQKSKRVLSGIRRHHVVQGHAESISHVLLARAGAKQWLCIRLSVKAQALLIQFNETDHSPPCETACSKRKFIT